MRPKTACAGGAGGSKVAGRTPLELAAAGQGPIGYTPIVRLRGRSKTRTAHCPTPYWADEVRAGRGPFPPSADTTPMVACNSEDRHCGREYPFYYGVGCTCLDCLNNAQLRRDRERRAQGLTAGPAVDDEPTLAAERPAELTPHAEALAEMERVNGRLLETRLPSEDEEALRDQIAHYRVTREILIFFGDGTAQPDPAPRA